MSKVDTLIVETKINSEEIKLLKSMKEGMRTEAIAAYARHTITCHILDRLIEGHDSTEEIDELTNDILDFKAKRYAQG